MKIFGQTIRVRVVILIGSLFIGRLDGFAENPYLMKELWVGKFEQSAPMFWSGEMLLYLRYNSHDSAPRTISGVIVWPGLGGSKTILSGEHSLERISFREESCANDGCLQVVLGGVYNGNFNELYTELVGEAFISGFKGRFKLKRVLAPE